ncbi:D-alanyl-D-alanine carboxypeptidase family protein [Paralimibaculum aggregatum]|uniref:serine-type D-Ala-D-Ala carboxypeptidase n=1 Tax=Paralimibaculum aggregatum TaxID=3036245 RepID=A0ABQ6LNF3_9RHOB|nr:D-alanyl-D-alanine carboxypeptidase family protein [Limibaculum sp. NKW23]GMG81790.1 D-alanyl-D-alanine carboxypeptidase family protein [Limibaculum sp. NKW23]
MLVFLRRAASAMLILLAATSGASAQLSVMQQSTPARAAILVDLSSGAVLLEKNADEALPPASMSKLMLLDVVFEAIDTGRLALTDEFRTSKRAAGMGGSKMFIREGGLVSVENLVRGVVVQSGNDAAVALAEALTGTEEAFAAYMNRRAGEIGLTNSLFANATGWPDPDHRMSARDLATLADRIITEFPEMYAYFSEEEFTWEGVTQGNRNPLLGLGLGVDGLKTGHTEEAGYGLVASAKRGNRRVVLVVTGLDSASQRKQEAERLINWAFRAFETRTLYRAGEPLIEAGVWIGENSRVPLAPAEDVIVTIPFGLGNEPTPRAEYTAPVEAPIAKGTELGRVTVEVEGMPAVSVPLVAVRDVPRGGFIARIEAAAELALSRFLPEF